jgi:hypothetical protein
MKRLRLVMSVAAAVSIALGATRARACNACREDKIAATFDWQVISAAKSRGHAVIFTMIRGPVTPGDGALQRTLARRLAAIPGVDAGTVRVSLEPPAASFACDPAHRKPDLLLGDMNRALLPLHLTLAILQVGAPGGAAALTRASP